LREKLINAVFGKRILKVVKYAHEIIDIFCTVLIVIDCTIWNVNLVDFRIKDD
jgi:hypothetical protein